MYGHCEGNRSICNFFWQCVKQLGTLKLSLQEIQNKEYLFFWSFLLILATLTLLKIWVFGVHLINLGHINYFEYLYFLVHFTKLSHINSFFQFFKSAPGPALHCTSDETLKDLLVFSRQNMPKPMFFQQLVILVNELDYKNPLKCINNGQEDALLLSKNGTVANLVNLEF